MHSMGKGVRNRRARSTAKAPITRVRDQSEFILSQLDPADLAQMAKQVRLDLVALSLNLLAGRTKSLPTEPAKLRDEESTAFISSLVERWSERLSLSGWDPAKWLYIVRRIPNDILDILVQGSLGPMVDRNDPRLSTIRQSVMRILPLLALGRRPIVEAVQRSGQLVYELTSDEALEVAGRIVATTHFVLLTNTARRASKGGVLVVRDDWPPYCEHDEFIEEAIDIYDQRAHSGLSLIAVAGSRLATEANSASGTTVFTCGPLESPRLEPVPLSVRPAGNAVGMEVRYEASLLDIGPFLQAVSQLPPNDRSWFDPSILPIISVLHCLSGDERLSEDELKWQISRVGNIWTSRSILNESYADRLDDIRAMRKLLGVRPDPPSFGETLRDLNALVISRSPCLPGPVVRSIKGGDQILVDVLAGTERLARLLFLASAGGGAASNWRAKQFEDDLQAMIDETEWAPDEGSRSLRKNINRIDGTRLTDIDAVATNGNTLILIDAKSYAYTLDYSIGDFKTVREYRTKLESDVAKWRKVITYMREHRVGGNYAVRGDVNIVGIVVTPFPVFVHGALLKEVLPGLREVVSVDELDSYLRPRKSKN